VGASSSLGLPNPSLPLAPEYFGEMLESLQITAPEGSGSAEMKAIIEEKHEDFEMITDGLIGNIFKKFNLNNYCRFLTIF